MRLILFVTQIAMLAAGFSSNRATRPNRTKGAA